MSTTIKTAETHAISLTINTEPVTALVPARMNLVDFLRLDQGLTGSHVGCEHGVCGACTIQVDGQPVRGCLMLAVQADGTAITTIEGMADTATGAALQAAFVAHNALQCGFCTPGMLASAVEYIDGGGGDDPGAIREHLSGNYCRCTGYQSIVEAVRTVIAARPGAGA